MTERDSLTYVQPAGEPYAGVSETLSAVVFFAGDRAYSVLGVTRPGLGLAEAYFTGAKAQGPRPLVTQRDHDWGGGDDPDRAAG